MATKSCSKCETPFQCSSDNTGCWCNKVFLDPKTLSHLKAEFKNCLCSTCLVPYAKFSNEPFFCSWSGGKDSCLAFYYAIRTGAKPKVLLTMMIESGERSRSHGLPIEVLEKQARSLGVPIRFQSASWASYEQAFSEAVNKIKQSDANIGVFGDIDLDPHRQWVERVCNSQNVQAWLPLWKRKRKYLLSDLISSGFKAEIIAVKDGVLSPELLGQTIDHDLVGRFEDWGIDPSGENGEYHTVVTAGPLFVEPIRLLHQGSLLKNGYWVSDTRLN